MIFRAGLITVLLTIPATPSHARPLLEHAAPASGSIVRASPSEIALSFSQALVASASDAVVRNASGGVVSSGMAHVSAKAGQVRVPVKPLSPGKYRVEWLATSSDNRHAQGSFSFVVGAEEKHVGSSRRGHRTRRGTQRGTAK